MNHELYAALKQGDFHTVKDILYDYTNMLHETIIEYECNDLPMDREEISRISQVIQYIETLVDAI